MKYKGYELLKAIEDGEIKEGDRLKFTNQQNGANITVTVGKDCLGNFVLKNVKPEIMEIFEITGFADILTIE